MGHKKNYFVLSFIRLFFCVNLFQGKVSCIT